MRRFSLFRMGAAALQHGAASDSSFLRRLFAALNRRVHVFELGDDAAKVVKVDFALIPSAVSENDPLQIIFGQIAMRLNPKGHFDIGQTDFALLIRVESLEHFSQSN